MKPQRPRWCPKCRESKPWQKIRLLGARASFKACLSCGSRVRPRKPGTKKRVPRPDSWKALMKACDDIARERAHSRGYCEHCHKAASVVKLEWAHGLDRIYHAVRHLDDNGRLLCCRCHTWFTHRWPEWEDWMIHRVGMERWVEIMRRRNDRCGVPELQATLAVLKSGEPCC